MVTIEQTLSTFQSIDQKGLYKEAVFILYVLFQSEAPIFRSLDQPSNIYELDPFWSTLDKFRFEVGSVLVHPGPLLIQLEVFF